MRRRLVRVLLLPFVALIFLVGWTFYVVGDWQIIRRFSKKSKAIPAGKKARVPRLEMYVGRELDI